MSFELVMAPMRGLTTVQFRMAFARHFSGIDRVIGPFIPTARGKKIKQSLLEDALPEHNRDYPYVPQIIGNDPDEVVCMCRALAELGWQEINWNMGCPWPQLAKKKRGSGLLTEPEIVEKVLETVFAQTDVRMSVKVRLGRKSTDDLEKILPLLNSFPLSEVIVHPRTAQQMYEGHVQLDKLEELLPEIKHPITYSGDLISIPFFQELQHRFPSIKSWMLGRGLITNPLLSEQLRDTPSATASRLRLQQFHEDLYASYDAVYDNDKPLLGKMKEWWSYVSQSFEDSHEVFKSIKHCSNAYDYRAAVQSLFASSLAYVPFSGGNPLD